jgi:hypothetical protein
LSANEFAGNDTDVSVGPEAEKLGLRFHKNAPLQGGAHSPGSITSSIDPKMA